MSTRIETVFLAEAIHYHCCGINPDLTDEQLTSLVSSAESLESFIQDGGGELNALYDDFDNNELWQSILDLRDNFVVAHERTRKTGLPQVVSLKDYTAEGLAKKTSEYTVANPEYELFGVPTLVNRVSESVHGGTRTIHHIEWVQFFNLKSA